MLKLIAAVAKDGGLGLNGQLLFSIREDMQRFKALTTGKTVIMGRETLDSLPGGRALPNRRNLVLTRNPDFSRERVEVFHDAESLLNAVRSEEEAWVIGGESIYRLLLPACEVLELTEVDAVRPADRFFPLPGEERELEHASDWKIEQGIAFRFCTYRRKNAPDR